ncbi:pentapeptide repeat-containing protein [Streptomyces sp. NRRL S-1521]|uniref:pentapeptide repeat-containing protein n=1 Tax=Streptomyces sp. NRRL S-1521 TaxID=1609100 RepID=UPI000D1505F6|nr:pentapeptide repeat-containing protein [Streptomyces sp. NRRL S-1521]
MTAKRGPRSVTTDRELRLWRVGRALTLAFVAAILVAGGVFYGLVVLLDFQEIDSTTKLDAKTLFDLVKLSFGVVAGAGALVALVVAYRRQRVDEAGAHRDATRLHTERFSQAVDRLGSDSPAVRLGGVHALAGLADDAPDDNLRQTCVDVLCAYLQLPFTPDPGGTEPAHQHEHHRYLALRKVRHTILGLIADHYRRPRGTHRSWQGCDLDLTGVTIDCDMDFSDAVFSGGAVNLGRAVFSGGVVSFIRAKFCGGAVYFGDAEFCGGSVHFSGAVFSGGTVHFGDAVFSGGAVYFSGAVFSGGTVHFGDAAFSGSSVHFSDAVFSAGTVNFRGAIFSGATVNFRDTVFSSGAVYFSGAVFSGGAVYFTRATGPAPNGPGPQRARHRRRDARSRDGRPCLRLAPRRLERGTEDSRSVRFAPATAGVAARLRRLRRIGPEWPGSARIALIDSARSRQKRWRRRIPPVGRNALLRGSDHASSWR